ncbi:c-type cytochrome [Flavivirga jejuensis]|uniref:Cytochrome c n=1 Tax=Flavivirga jejuensis TaxID=870487 RepID=A0ABT8WQR8_9FLAO|nr:cytochrome c [Flavivirga jejuensis]MDO5975471.1 cytochrome c [Flavivirga jejuensis]
MNRILKITGIKLLLIISALFFSCEASVEEDDEQLTNIPENEVCDSNISFVSQIKPIIDNNCISCHGGNQPPNLSSYSGISNSANNVKTQVVSRRMPQGGSLSSTEIELISCWVDNGALNN